MYLFWFLIFLTSVHQTFGRPVEDEEDLIPKIFGGQKIEVS